MNSPRINAQLHGRLPVFAAAARHLSFTRAAHELNVTPGAVSQQLRQLESRLGVKLFNRTPRGVALTAEGQRLAQVVSRSYGELDEVLSHLRAGRIGGNFRLRSIPSFLEKWLMPRLSTLQQAYPDISFRFVAEDSSWSLRDGEFDLAIDLNEGIYPGLATTVLVQEHIFPVCAPSLLARGPALRCPHDLAHYPLLHDITAWRGSYAYAEWSYYLDQYGQGETDVRRGTTFNRYSLSLEAARAGLGVALARQTLITDELVSGALCVPFGTPIPNRKHYVLVYPSGALADARVRAVHDWFVTQFASVAQPISPDLAKGAAAPHTGLAASRSKRAAGERSGRTPPSEKPT